MPLLPHPSFCLWRRIYTHALLLDSQIFPSIELSDESPEYTLSGITDFWKGIYRGEPVCIKAIRTQDPIRLKEIKRVYGSFLISKMHSSGFMTFRRYTNEHMYISELNVLPIINVSETRFPFCIMSPWMPGGNVTQYTQMNPGANRFLLVCSPQPEDRQG